ncbi:MAG: HAD hydrolase-like protein [Kiritimatiellae bacterium]|nr:HAD hydrolase-like protein [Kiritimatiellia bacterium]
MKRFWFFDLDGTLADTDCDIRMAWKDALKDLGIVCENFDRDFIAGPPIDEMAKRLLPEIYTDELAQKIRVGFGVHYDNDGFPNTREYPGVLNRVREIKAAGGRPYIVTNKRYIGAKLMAEKFGWMQVFERLYTGDMHKDNPAIGKLRKPELLALVMREIGAKPEECVMVGDTISDFEAAEKNGIESVAVAWGYGAPEELAKADRLARNAKEV